MQDSQDMFEDTQDPKSKQGKPQFEYFKLEHKQTDPLHRFLLLKWVKLTLTSIRGAVWGGRGGQLPTLGSLAAHPWLFRTAHPCWLLLRREIYEVSKYLLSS